MTTAGPMTLLLIALAVILIWVIVTAIFRGGDGAGRGAHACAGCGALHPDRANFCRRCGRELR